MKKFLFVHYGFERPTPEIMAAWGKWFESMKDNTIGNVGFSGGREISKAGTKELPLGAESITGISIVSAGSLDEAEKMARSNPYISSIRVYEVRSKWICPTRSRGVRNSAGAWAESPVMGCGGAGRR